MALKVAERSLVSPFMVMEVMRSAARREAMGEHVLHLEVGQPSSSAPARVIDAAKAALSRDILGYTMALGLPDLREAIASYYKHSYGLSVTPERIVVTMGSSAAFVLAFLSAFNPGDRVAVAAPSYPAYRNILQALGVDAVCLEVGEETHFQITADVLRGSGLAFEGVIIASPSNPTGSMIASDELRALVEYCRQAGTRIISDEIYHGITFGRRADSLAGDQEVIVINSFSKYFSMTGWRLGWMVVPSELIPSIECLAPNLFIAPPTLSQIAAIEVFECLDDLDANVRRYAENRDILLNELPKAGFSKLAPADGAFYLYADISAFCDDSVAFCKALLDQTGVAITPGVDFDPINGRKSVRLSFAGSQQTMIDAAHRIKTWCQHAKLIPA